MGLLLFLKWAMTHNELFALLPLQMLGHKEGLAVMERADPLFLLLGLPAIPVLLILGKMLRWEDYVLRLWRKHYVTLAKFFGSKYSFNFFIRCAA